MRTGRRLFQVMVIAVLFAAGASAGNPTSTCGRTLTVNLLAGQTINAGNISVANDANYLYVTYNTGTTGWFLSETHLHVASSLAEIPQTKSGNPKIGNFTFKRTYSPLVTEDTYIIPLADYGWDADRTTPIFIAAHAVVVKKDSLGSTIATETGWAQGLGFPGGSWAMYFNYQMQSCRTIENNLVLWRTQTQGGWGTVARGGNPGSFRDANFSGAFPNNLLIGSGNRTAAFTSSAAVACFLPQGSTPGSLGANYLNPGLNADGTCAVDPNSQNTPAFTTAGVLAGQVTALTLNVRFDEYCRTAANNCTFQGKDGLGLVLLKNLIVKPGNLCEGWTVSYVLEQANLILGGAQGAQYLSPAQINQCVSSINEEFVDGIGAVGYLSTP